MKIANRITVNAERYHIQSGMHLITQIYPTALQWGLLLGRRGGLPRRYQDAIHDTLYNTIFR
jgi:hypothetical protein